MEVFQSWDSLQYGDSWSGVLTTVVRLDNGDVLGTTAHRPPKQVLIRGHHQEFSHEFLVIEAKVVQVSPILTCEIGETSVVAPVPVCQAHHLHAVVELCSGMGVFSSMATVVSMGVKVGIGQNPKWESLFRQLHPGAEFLACEVGNMKAVRYLVAHNLFHPVIVAGVSCQPHSQAGDKMGMKDQS